MEAAADVGCDECGNLLDVMYEILSEKLQKLDSKVV